MSRSEHRSVRGRYRVELVDFDGRGTTRRGDLYGAEDRHGKQGAPAVIDSTVALVAEWFRDRR